MKKSKIFLKMLRCIAAILGAVITVNAVALFFVSNLNFGNFLMLGLGIVILVLTLPVKPFLKIPKWIKCTLSVCVCVAVAFSSFLIIYGSRNTTDYREDAVIVLGAAVHKDKPSLTLKRRLDKAIEYHNQNPQAIIVVSGGKGQGENVTEAEAMSKYLAENGVDPEKIVLEDKAVSTYTNFKYSKEILDERLNEDYSVCYITNEFHIMRAGLCAKTAGYESVSYLHSGTDLSYIISASLRECFAVMKYIVLKR